MAKKKKGFDIHGASTSALADMGGNADQVAKRMSALSSEIKVELRERAGNLPDDEVVTAVGEDFTVSVGQVPTKVNVKEMDNADIIAKVGQEVFNALASFPVTVLKDHLARADYEELITTSPGTRSVSFKERNVD